MKCYLYRCFIIVGILDRRDATNAKASALFGLLGLGIVLD